MPTTNKGDRFLRRRGGGDLGEGAAGGPLADPGNALVGRREEVATLDRLLAAPDTRLLTLTGPPGVGKTRLAIAVATATAPRFPDGVAFVDLAGVRDPGLVPAAVLTAVGAEEPGAPEAVGRLVRTLTGRDMLLVVDNFEHVLDAGPALTAALAGSVGLRLLVTSRERLHLQAEREVPIRPLTMPSAGDDPGPPAAAPPVELLVERVRRFEPGFDVTPANHAALAEICARLDGLPLALELAAERLKLFTPVELASRLDHRLSILTGTLRDVPSRHRTLRAALAWSHDLLAPNERAAFRRLSVFADGATLDAAGQVCDLDDPVATVTSLVDKSLLYRRIRPDGAAEFVMLASLREYAAELLVEHGEADAVRARHARYFSDLAVLVETAVGESGEAERVESVGPERGNLRAALAHAAAVADAGVSLPLASVLSGYARVRARPGAGPAAPDTAPAVVDPVRAPPAPVGAAKDALLVAATQALGRGDLVDAEGLLSRVLALDGDQRRTAIATAFLGHVTGARGHCDRAAGHHGRAAGLFAALGDLPGAAWSRFALALLAGGRGDSDAAAHHLQESLTRFRSGGDLRAVGCATRTLATLEVRRDRADEAERLLREAVGCCEAVPDGPCVTACLAGTSAARCTRQLYRGAARPVPHTDPADDGREPGRAGPRATTVALFGRRRGGEPAGTRGGLTLREQEVARLVANGCTNRQIGRALGISEKTTEVHVHNIIRKLGAGNRAEVAAWVGVHDRPG